MDERDYQFMNKELNMEQFKLDLSKLEYVREENRVQGNWYVAVDNIVSSMPLIVQWHSGDRSMTAWGGQSVKFNFWLQIPPNLPGFPEAELPDEFELMDIEWDVETTPNSTIIKRIKNPNYPELTIPSGTKAEQIDAVRKILAELETK